MKLTPIIILFFYTTLIYSQNTIVDFISIVNTNDAVIKTKIDYKLIMNDSTSCYYNITKDESQFKEGKHVYDKKKKNDVIEIKLTDNHTDYLKDDFYFKNFIKDSLTYNELIATKKVVIGEKNSIFEWTIKPNSDTLVMGFKCQKAISKFRGRTYEAIFSSEIAPHGGPWKFDGLPGFIVSVKSLDNYFIIVPTKIIVNTASQNICDNIYINQKIISWSNFRQLFKENLERILKKLKSMSEDGEGASIKITDKIEDLEIGELKF